LKYGITLKKNKTSLAFTIFYSRGST